MLHNPVKKNVICHVELKLEKYGTVPLARKLDCWKFRTDLKLPVCRWRRQWERKEAKWNYEPSGTDRM